MIAMLRLMLLVVLLMLNACSDQPVSNLDKTTPPAPASDKGQVSGVVRDAAGQPIVGAKIGLIQGPGPMIEMVQLTNERGEYDWPGLTPGQWTLAAYADGFKSQELTASVTAGGTTTLDFTLAR
jgi:hypothetical protein